MDQPVYTLSAQELFQTFNTKLEGLTNEDAAKRLKQYGPNLLTPKKKTSALSLYLGQFKNTLTLILLGATVLILFIYFFGKHDPSDLIEAGLILAIIFMITILGFVQEFKADRAIESLKKLLAFRAKVRRDNRELEIDVETLVIGDIVILEEGTKVPADIRLIQVFSLSVNEAPLTGESNPVNKKIDLLQKNLQIADQINMIFAGTAIASGRGIGIVTKIGDSTEIGKIAKDVSRAKEDQTPIQKKLNNIGKMIGYVILGVCSIVFIFILFFAQEFLLLPLQERIIHSFIAAVALAVAAIPEGLPAVVTISLALGTQRMLKKQVLVRKLNSVETLGSTDVICSDKTGTLTKGEMTVRKIYQNNEYNEVSGAGYETTGTFSKNNNPVTLNKLLEIGLFCNNASLNSEKFLGDPTEIALLVAAKKGSINSKFERVHEIPFNSQRKMMSVVLKDKEGYIVYVKGAPEIILAKCTKLLNEKEEIILKDINRKNILSKNDEMSKLALRNLGFAYKRITKEEYDKQSKDDNLLENNLTFVGISGMIDPPRNDVKPLIENLNISGIRVIMITGDHIETAKAVAKEIGIIGNAATSEELDKLSDEEFAKKVETTSVYARINPGFKMRIVDVLKKKGHIVAMTGDGVNDAPALKRADIGIAMGITGTDVAKEASDMILLDDHFGTIVSAIEEGRGIFHNIKKFVNYLLACNIGEIMIVFVAIMIFQKLPLTATMLLWINVVTDGLPAVALGLDRAEKGIMNYSPKIFQKEIVNSRMWIEMFIYGILLTIAVLGIFALTLPQGLAQAQGAAFSAIVMFELVKVYIIRTRYKIPFLSNPWLLLSVLTSIIVQIGIVHLPFISKLFEINPIGLFEWTYILFACMALWIIFKLIQKLLDRKDNLSLA